jgi:nondiscriminating glutamyl-tRNA synthetase
VIRARFAPSPTGSLHVGNARLAVLNWLFARHSNGSFILRIEDTDEERNLEGSEAQILEDLAWLGLKWDEGPTKDGEVGLYGPYRQSERTRLHQDYAKQLLQRRYAFNCYCTDEEVEARRDAAIARGDSATYDGTCLRRTPEEIALLIAEGRVPAIRFHVPEGDDIVVEDVIRGNVHFPRADIGDFIILRSDGQPTYNFAVVVDDIVMAITHVIRGVGHLSNTPRQVLVFDAFGAPRPVFAHVPQVLGPDRQKLSKRHGAPSLADYRRDGYHPDGLVNYLSLLSWSSPSGEEVLTREQLVSEITLERVGAADVVFDPAKLDFLSAKHIERMSIEDLVVAVEPFVDTERFQFTSEQLNVAVKAVRTHLVAFSKINEFLAPFVPIGSVPLDALRQRDSSGSVLDAARVAFGDVKWDVGAIAEAIKAVGKQTHASGKALYDPIRLTLTGEEHGSPLNAIIFVQGRDAVMQSLDRALDALRS